MTDEELVTEIREGREHPGALWVQLNRFIRSIAARYAGVAEVEDLMQESYFGLLQAIAHYEQDRDVSFASYAHYWINQAMLRSIANTGQIVRVPVNAALTARRYSRTVSNFRKETGRDPTEQELCAALDVSPEQLQQIRTTDTMLHVGSIDTPLSEDPDAVTVGDMVQDPEAEVEEQAIASVYQEQLERTLWGSVDTLPQQQAAVLRRRYQDGMTMAETGAALGVSIARIHTVEETALRRLRSGKLRKQLSPFLDDLRYSIGVHGSLLGYKRSGMSSTEKAAFESMGRLEELLRGKR